ncbi:MAG: hypothetical protein D3905_12505, partial [Candidatus Electrothrix sp. AS4_5]|nr:hypothetical protein [Candidatus Electrothrix gigas]
YCTELAVDGAARVRFEKPVTVWVDNFLGFEVGEAVPVGYYDRDRGVWVPSENGIVVKLLDTDSDGVVDALDSTGDDQPNDLNNDGSFADEVTGLGDASRYAPGATFWRTAVTHFTPWDCNWPFGPKEDAIPPNGKGTPDAEGAETTDGKKPDDTDCINSYVKKRGRIFHEDIPIPGTGMTLHYASNRVDGYKQVITVPASGDTVPESLKSIIVEVELAGRTLTQTLEPLPKQQAQFVWDGLDYLGREVGTVDADVSVGFVYDAVYLTAGNFANAFAQAGSDVTPIRARQEVISWQRFEIQVGAGKAGGNIAEGWTLSDHHVLGIDVANLYKGNGSILENENSKIITTIAGTGGLFYNGDNILAVEASLHLPEGMAMDQEGNIFIADTGNDRIRKVDGNGIITTVAGNSTNVYDSAGYSGDNGPATEAKLNEPKGVAVDQIGNIFIADTGNRRIRKVDTAGIITTVAGNGSRDYSGDNGPAIEAGLSAAGVAVDQAGNIFIADDDNRRIRKVDADGIISTIAGTGDGGIAGNIGDNDLATEADLYFPRGVAVDQIGNIFFTEYYGNRILKIDPTGIIHKVAGGSTGHRGDDIPTAEAGIGSPRGLAVDQAGNIIVADRNNHCIRKIDPNGIITTVAGNGTEGYNGDNIPATEASLYSPRGLAVDQAGNIFIADTIHRRIRKVEFASAVFKSDLLAPGEIPFADPNGLGYIMSATGLHKKTINLDSGFVLQEFGYDSEDNLISITDQFGNITTIERSADGIPTAIVSPDGLSTELHINADKQLTKITYPDNTAYSFTYTADDLMTVETEPNGNRFEHNFDKNGKIVEVLDEEGGQWQYSRQRLANGDIQIDSVTAEGNSTINLDNNASTGAFFTTTIDPSGNQSTFSRSADGLSEERELSCGMSSTTEYGLDAEYKYKVVQSTSTQSPAGLTKIAQIDKTYQDTDANELPDLMTETISRDGRLTTLEHNTLTG